MHKLVRTARYTPPPGLHWRCSPWLLWGWCADCGLRLNLGVRRRGGFRKGCRCNSCLLSAIVRAIVRATQYVAMADELLHYFCCFERNSLFAIDCVKGCYEHLSSAVAAAKYCNLTPCRFHPFSKHPTNLGNPPTSLPSLSPILARHPRKFRKGLRRPSSPNLQKNPKRTGKGLNNTLLSTRLAIAQSPYRAPEPRNPKSAF